MTYTSWLTIENVIKQKLINKFKIFSDDDGLIYAHEPKGMEAPIDTANTLKEYLDSLEGTNYAKVKLITPAHKGQRGGNTQDTVYTYYYRLRPNGKRGNGMEGDSSMFALLLNMTKELERERSERQLAEMRRELEEIKKGSKGNGNMSSLEKIAYKIGQGIYSEMKHKGALSDDVSEDVQAHGQEQTQQPKKPVKKEKPERPEATEKDFSKRSSQALKRLAKVGGFGVANALEDIADMAEENPQKLIEIFRNVKE